ncbi:hypothetical protein E7744_00680 [Citricoccus sp. SGAir0253]|uniref:hypothetical protein n=1 Tax=Citricoccus sp. SGAir0253 TaxID=2567881 RepID=UPI0010CD22EE|nr:hypothetical protein [Citricoccus sp. SGAir0253]QCU76909.1 hypothetical protein E7744_00680 [Citricoccus sp. SGAir0253]
MQWFAAIAVVAILVWGLLMLVSMTTGTALPGRPGAPDPDELADLRRRVEELERGAVPPELERRIDRLEARLDRREARELEQDRWTRQARELGLDDDGRGPGAPGPGPHGTGPDVPDPCGPRPDA